MPVTLALPASFISRWSPPGLGGWPCAAALRRWYVCLLPLTVGPAYNFLVAEAGFVGLSMISVWMVPPFR